MTPLEAALRALADIQPGYVFHAGKWHTDEKQALVLAKCRGLMAGYHSRWNGAPYVIGAVETLVESDLWNPGTGRKSRTFRVAGKLDVTGWHTTTGRRVIFDHKTTSDDISDPASPYWQQLTVEAQPSHYALLEWLNGRKVEEIVWDVVRKPGISPRAVSKDDSTRVAITGTYFGREMSDGALANLRQTGREDLEMYEARLAWDCINERPQWYFQRKDVPRSDASLHEYATDLWANSLEVQHARKTGHHPKNHKACMYKNSPCKFLGICSGKDTVDSDKWQKKTQVHVELPILEGDGRDILTNSRLGEFMLCRRKHYYQYELGIERMDEEEREALYFGNCWHTAQEAYFNALKGEQSEHTNVSDAPVIEVGLVSSTDETPEYF